MPFEYNLGDRTPSDEPASFRQHAFDKIYTAIYDGTLEPGEELADQELSDWLQMSRQPIRYALQHLADLGLVVLGNGRAPRVSELDPARANRTLLVGGMYNTYAASVVVGNLSDEQLVRLDDACAEVQSAHDDRDRTRSAEGVNRFFRVLSEALDNPVITAHFARMSYELGRFLQPGGSLVDPDSLAEPIAALNTAIQAGDRHRAMAITRRLFEATRDNFVEQFRTPMV